MNVGTSVFITGIPTAGKTWLSRRLASRTGCLHVGLDDLRAEMMNDVVLRPWVRFYLDRDEREHFVATSCARHLENLINQSEAFWPRFVAAIRDTEARGVAAIYESVCLLPHLVNRDLKIPGICLLATSLDAVRDRLRLAPRWGLEAELQHREADVIWNCEQPWYEAQSRRFGIPVYSDMKKAEAGILELIKPTTG